MIRVLISGVGLSLGLKWTRLVWGRGADLLPSFPAIVNVTTIQQHTMSTNTSNGASQPVGDGKPALDPITRNALRYTISPKEYAALHHYLVSRAPERVQKNAPSPQRFDKLTRPRTETSEYNISSFRVALRVFAAAYIGLKAYENLTLRLARRKAGPEYV